MLDRDRAYKILKEALEYSDAEQTEVRLSGGKSGLTRFANNYIHQNVLKKDYVLTVKAIYGKKVGISSCNIFDGENLKDVVQNACEIAKHSKEDAELLDLLEPQKYSEFPKSYFDRTIDFSPINRAEAVQSIIKLSQDNNMTAFGTLSNGDYMYSIMNSKGLFAYHNYTSCSFTFTATNSEDGTGWAEYYTNDIDDLMDNLEPLTLNAINKAKLNINPITIEPGEYTVILEEAAVNSLLSFLNYLGFGGLAYNEDRSFMAGRLGNKLMGENITIYDDSFNKEVLGFPFDFEGMPKQKLMIIENGIAKAVAHDRKTAKKANTISTGHALPSGSTFGPIPLNIIMETGNSEFNDMIKSTDYGILVSRFWYDNVVDEKRAIITGMTRDGLFLIKNGEIVSALKNMRYNEELPLLFNRVVAIANKRKSFGDMAVPAIKVNNFKFTGISKV